MKQGGKYFMDETPLLTIRFIIKLFNGSYLVIQKNSNFIDNKFQKTILSLPIQLNLIIVSLQVRQKSDGRNNLELENRHLVSAKESSSIDIVI